jgi:hypothetical protein
MKPFCLFLQLRKSQVQEQTKMYYNSYNSFNSLT